MFLDKVAKSMFPLWVAASVAVQIARSITFRRFMIGYGIMLAAVLLFAGIVGFLYSVGGEWILYTIPVAAWIAIIVYFRKEFMEGWKLAIWGDLSSRRINWR